MLQQLTLSILISNTIKYKYYYTILHIQIQKKQLYFHIRAYLYYICTFVFVACVSKKIHTFKCINVTFKDSTFYYSTQNTNTNTLTNTYSHSEQ